MIVTTWTPNIDSVPTGEEVIQTRNCFARSRKRKNYL